MTKTTRVGVQCVGGPRAECGLCDQSDDAGQHGRREHFGVQLDLDDGEPIWAKSFGSNGETRAGPDVDVNRGGHCGQHLWVPHGH